MAYELLDDATTAPAAPRRGGVDIRAIAASLGHGENVAELARSIYQQESGGGRNTTTSNAGAVGGMQIIPATFKRFAAPGERIDDPEHNARAGVRYVAHLLERAGGDMRLAAAGYYGGEGAIDKLRRGVAVSDPRNPKAPTTAQYADQVVGRLPAAAPAARGGYTLLDDEPTAAPKPAGPGALERIGNVARGEVRGLGNVLAGAVRGAGSIGATLLDVGDAVERGLGFAKGPSPDRRGGMDGGLQALGADPTSGGYGLGKLAGEVAGTAGAGGLIARGAATVPGVAAKMPGLLAAIQSGGLSAGGAGMATRVAGGAINGAAAAGMVDPGSAGVGGVIGGALPPAIKGLGAAGTAAARLARPGAAKGDALARALEVTDPAGAAAQLRAAPELVPGSVPTVAQALGTPQAGVVQRVVHDSPGGTALKDAIAAQHAARMAALDGVAPIQPLGAAQARADVGSNIARHAQAEEALAATTNRQQYAAIDPSMQSRTVLPGESFSRTADTYTGPGYFGGNTDPERGAKIARDLSAPPKPPPPAPPRDVPIFYNERGLPLNAPEPAPAPLTGPRGSTWDEVSRLRASLNERWNNAKNMGDDQAAAALDKQKKALDAAVESSLPPEMLARWKEANASHAALMGRFHNGPQSAIFATRNGEPLAQGAEVAQKFWNGTAGAPQDVQALRRLIDDNPGLLEQFRSMVTTEGASTANASGNLGPKFTRWVDQRAPALAEAFDAPQVGQLRNIADDIRRAGAADAAGRGPGSNTYQNAANALSLGVLDSPIASALANRVPLIGPAFGAGRDYMRNVKARQMAELLADPKAAAKALEAMARAKGPARRGLLSLDPLEFALLRGAPVAAAD